MIIVGDIGNTETKICLINSKNKIIKRVIFNTKKINSILLKKYLSKLNLLQALSEASLAACLVKAKYPICAGFTPA